MQKFETELSKISNQKGIIESQETKIRRLKDKLSRSKRSQSQDLEDAQNEVAESYKLQVRMLEEKCDNQERCNSQRIVELERILKEQKESLVSSFLFQLFWWLRGRADTEQSPPCGLTSSKPYLLTKPGISFPN
jgi:hypothetical protein